MNKLLNLILCCIIIFNSQLNGMAQSHNNKAKSKKVEKVEIQTPDSGKLKAEEMLLEVTKLIEKQSITIEKYEAKLEEVEKEKDGVVKILLWSIGSIIIMIFTFLAVSVYFNYRIGTKEVDNIKKQLDLDTEEKFKNFKLRYESDVLDNKKELEKLTNSIKIEFDNLSKESSELQKDILNSYDEEIQAIRKENSKLLQIIEHKFSAHVEEQRKELKVDTNVIKSNFQKQLDKYDENYKQQIVALERSYNKQFESIEKTLKLDIRSVENKQEKETVLRKETMRRLENKLKEEDNFIKASIYRVKAYMWKYAGVDSNSLRAFINEGEKYIELNHLEMLELSLDGILNVMDEMDNVSEYDSNQLTDFLEKVPNKYKDLKVKIEILHNEKVKKA